MRAIDTCGRRHRLERFYHRWFTNDRHIVELVRELGCEDQIVARPSRTGLYYNRSHFRLSTPMDLLRFTPLSLPNRIRLGLLLFKVRGVRDWRDIEHLNVREWLVPLCGAEVFRVVWEPLLKAKFSIYAKELAATWFWKKLQLRGRSRSNGGAEMLAHLNSLRPRPRVRGALEQSPYKRNRASRCDASCASILRGGPKRGRTSG